MICRMVQMSRPMNVLDVLCAQLTRDLFAIAEFLFCINICWFSTRFYVFVTQWLN